MDKQFNNTYLRKLRENKNYSYDVLAGLLHLKDFKVSSQTLANWENGEFCPDGNQIAGLAKFYGVNVEGFFR